MPLYCPNCQALSAASARCHRCGDRLVTPSEVVPDGPALPPPDLIRPTAGARVSIGCIVALGLYLGLHEAVSATNLNEEWWTGTLGVAVATSLRAIGVLVGALLAGAGRTNGATSGATIGLVCGGAYLAADAVTGAEMLMVDGVAWAGLAILAAAAGQAGGRMWPPPADLPEPDLTGRSSSLARLVEEGKKARSGRPTSWLRIIAGVAIAVAGVAAADEIRGGLKKGSAGLLDLGSPVHAPLVDLQIAAMAIGVAGIVAGASTGAGLRHGLITGLLAGLGIAGLSLGETQAVAPVIQGLLQILALPTDQPTSAVSVAATLLAVLGACTVGGWFGGQLLPPLVPWWARGRRLSHT